MSCIKKIGYVAIVFWGFQISLSIVYKLYKAYFTKTNPINLLSLGDWAVVTGCSRGIGKAFVEVLAEKGLNIVLVSAAPSRHNSQPDSAEDIAEYVERSFNIRTRVVYLNPASGLDAYKLIEKVIVGLEVGVLVNNFGQNNPHPEYFLDLPHHDKIYTSIIQSNIVVTTNMCRVVLPQMLLRRKGVIINVASSTAVIPSPLLAVYAATKAYVLKFSKSLHMEYSKYGIIVQCLLPASIAASSVKNCSVSSSSWISPTPKQYVENTIKTIGKDEITTGFLPHAIFLWVVQLIYKLSPSFVILTITSIMEITRNQAVQKYVC